MLQNAVQALADDDPGRIGRVQHRGRGKSGDVAERLLQVAKAEVVVKRWATEKNCSVWAPCFAMPPYVQAA